MAEGLGIGVVAEGVETELQRKTLRGLGAVLAQGYLFARPVPAAECERLLERSRTRRFARRDSLTRI